MDEYISREALMRDLSESLIFSVRDGVIGREIRGANKVIDRIKAAPSADVVEVVRCKDCIYEDTTSCPLCYIEKHTLQFINHDGAFYCAKGKQKDGAGE